jgi:hypothetical protein
MDFCSFVSLWTIPRTSFRIWTFYFIQLLDSWTIPIHNANELRILQTRKKDRPPGN